MKLFTITFLINIIFVCTSFAQKPFSKPCEDVIVVYKELEGETSYKLPERWDNENIRILRTKDDVGDFKKLHFSILTDKDISTTGLYLKLQNGQYLRFPGQVYSEKLYRDGDRLLQAFLDIDAALYKKISTNFIVKFNIAGVDAEVLPQHIDYLKSHFICVFR